MAYATTSTLACTVIRVDKQVGPANSTPSPGTWVTVRVDTPDSTTKMGTAIKQMLVFDQAVGTLPAVGDTCTVTIS